MLGFRTALSVPEIDRPMQRVGRNCLLFLLAAAFVGGSSCPSYSQAAAERAAQVDLQSGPAAGAPGQRVAFAHPALAFEPNLGQETSRARFLSYGQGYVLRLDPDKASLAFLHGARSGSRPAADASRIQLKWLDANAHAAMIPEEKQEGVHSFFPSGDRKSWIPDIPAYGRVSYKEVYPGVDLSFYGHAGRLEYDFILKPHANSGRIRLAARGAEDLRVDKDGNLLLGSGGEAITLLKPVAYQLSPDGCERQPVPVQYRIGRDGASNTGAPTVSFTVGKYDRQRPLVIDPVMVYGLDIPGESGYSYPPYYYADTNISAMTADAAGNTYVAATVGNSYASTSVMKFDPNGNLLFNVSLGSTSTYITPNAIAVDAAGDVYLAGTAQPGLPTTAGAFQATSPYAYQSGFVTVIKADGSALIYSSYLGASYTVDVTGLAVDSSGAAYLTGVDSAVNFPTTAGSYETVSPGGYEQSAAFVSKINPKLSGAASLVYSTYLSGIGTSQGNKIAVDGSGDAYIAGMTSAGFPVTAGAYNFEGESSTEAFVAELNPAGSALVYSAILGPGNPAAIAVDTSGDAYLTGSVTASNFPVTTGAYQTSYAGGFATELNNTGSALVYSTFLSGPSGYLGYTPTGHWN